MSAVIWTANAIADLDRYLAFLQSVNPQAAQKAARKIRNAGQSLSTSPRRCPAIQNAQGLRKMNVTLGRYGVVIHYIIFEDDVIILQVYHGRENRPI
jgi:plasmid stabilization system protein ParE